MRGGAKPARGSDPVVRPIGDRRRRSQPREEVSGLAFEFRDSVAFFSAVHLRLRAFLIGL